jgi:aldehyde:ferredoxin oxidoreductase
MHMAEKRTAREILEAQKVLGEFQYEPKRTLKGYTGEILRVDISEPSFRIIPVTEQMKEIFIGGKGFDLLMTWQEVNPKTKWDSPENPICISSGPLGGTTSFPGSGKSIVTTISPTTGSVIDSNVGGHFGPLLKFAGFDGLVVLGKAERDVIVYINGMEGRVTVEESPLLSTNTHLVADELAEMYSDDQDDKRHISTVSAGRGAENSWIGCLNFSWWDWRRHAMRVKQAGRGGSGSVFRRKGLKALVVKAPKTRPTWTIVEEETCGEDPFAEGGE